MNDKTLLFMKKIQNFRKIILFVTCYFSGKILYKILLFPILKIRKKSLNIVIYKNMFLLKKFLLRFQPLKTLFLKFDTVEHIIKILLKVLFL